MKGLFKVALFAGGAYVLYRFATKSKATSAGASTFVPQGDIQPSGCAPGYEWGILGTVPPRPGCVPMGPCPPGFERAASNTGPCLAWAGVSQPLVRTGAQVRPLVNPLAGWRWR